MAQRLSAAPGAAAARRRLAADGGSGGGTAVYSIVDSSGVLVKVEQLRLLPGASQSWLF
jgi:hypothetical protein